MPFLDNYSEDELKKKQEEQTPTTQQSSVLGAGQQTSMATGSGKGSGWTNLQTYLDNNAGQGVQTTQKILDVKQDQIKNAVDSLNSEVNDTKTKASQGMVQRNTDLENQIKTNPTAVNQDAFSQYVSKSYAGPNQFTPGLDTEKKWNGLQTKTNVTEIADPYKIGQQLKKDNYTYGLGKLDSYLINSEGGGVVDSFNQKNANVVNDRASQIQSVNDAINVSGS
jgi:hypothetical protein